MENKLNNTNPNEGLAYASNKRKIGFFGAMLVVVGSSIGAGIFFKAGNVLENSQGSVVFAIFCWILAAFAIICMSLALVEIASARNDNLSIIGWCKTFNKRFIYKACKNFIFYIYTPLTFFFMPMYIIMSIQDGINGFTNADPIISGKGDWAIAMLISIIITIYFLFVSGLSSRAGNIQNWIITSVKFLPIVFTIIIGFVIVGISGFQNGQSLGNGIDFDDSHYNQFSFSKLSPGIGMFIAIGAIFFAYDGFYVGAGIQSELKEPKKTPIIILVGMIVVTIIYLLVAISMSISSSQGNPFGLKNWLQKHTAINGVNWVYGLFQILIGIGILGIVNGFAMWAPRFTEDLIKEGEIPFSFKLIRKTNNNKPIVGVIYMLVLSIPFIVLFSIIGGLGYINSNYTHINYGDGMGALFSFSDLMTTWTAVIAFAFILFSIYGGLRNRKTNLVKVQKNKYFVPMAWCSIIGVGLPLLFTLLDPIINVFLLFNMPGPNKDEIISRLMLIFTLIIYLLFTLVPIWIEDYVAKKKYGSIQNYEIWKEQKLHIIISNHQNNM